MKPWGIVLVWRESGLECCIWAHHILHAARLEFSTEAAAQHFMDELLVTDGVLEMHAMPRQLT